MTCGEAAGHVNLKGGDETERASNEVMLHGESAFTRHLRACPDLGMGQNRPTRGWQVLVFGSIYQGSILGTHV